MYKESEGYGMCDKLLSPYFLLFVIIGILSFSQI